ncbi:NAD-dependent epimerase/dehydratase family protein [Jeotgalibacillus sp. S-D1]|uniref:SDR family oxidoreductase n=1 Tax=Jeotgalibacillus sp. S-D1 TaxID=2552189 RepID=UPI001059E894|nr:SDR family oxidoreductase [Jeotgalibacillus sp. S-D1]TDL35242.1 NAD-dependent epimerase/dehydratase family protein [Jeotgalibacillus sp. S-D1]
MRPGYFVTGFPGFISEHFIKLWLSDKEAKNIYLLVQPSMSTKANEKVEHLLRGASNRSTIQIIEGDITKNHLGLPDPTKDYLKEKIQYVWHLAAIYDLAVPKSLAFKVNVTGTYHVNEWVQSLPHIKRYVYFSTAYIAGKREGSIKAGELIRPEAFRNHYEETKYEAEVLVDRLKNHIPTTIIRPGIVKGSVKSGETTKFDGPYYMMNIIDRLKGSSFIPYIGRSATVLNVVPVDYVVKAANWLGHLEAGAGKTYHLTDPNPYPARELFRFIMIAQTGRKPSYSVPHQFVDRLLSFKAARKLLRVERESVEYFFWKGSFDQGDTEQDLAGTGITCPDFLEGLEPMISFYNLHKRDERFHPPVN